MIYLSCIVLDIFTIALLLTFSLNKMTIIALCIYTYFLLTLYPSLNASNFEYIYKLFCWKENIFLTFFHLF